MPPSEHEDDKVERLKRAMYSRSLSDKLKDRPRRELEEGRPIVGDDFVTHENPIAGTVVAPRMIGTARTVLWWILGLAVLFFLGAVGFFGYYFSVGGGSLAASPQNIGIQVSGPSQVRGGTPTELQITVNNKNNTALESADLLVTYPSGTRSPTDFSTDFPNQRISLGSIEAGGTRQGTVSAVFSGQAGDRADVKVELEYRIAGSNAIFVASSDYALLFSSSPLSVAVNGNSETISGQPFQLTIAVSSNASAPVRDVLVSATYPFGFTFSSATPAPAGAGSSSSSGFWQLGDLAPGQTKTITLQGTLIGEEGDNRVFRFDTGTRDNATSTSISDSLADESFPVAVTKSFLGLSVSVNGASGNNVIVEPGDNVPVSVAWQNNLSTEITNAVIVAKLAGFEIDGSTVRSSTGFYRSTDDTMLWDKTTDPTLADLAPGAHGVVSFSFQMPSGDALKGVNDPVLDISINAAGDRVAETGVPENLQAVADQKIAVASDLQFSARGLYYSNPFGSTGPMPPKAGTETTYAVVLTVTNTTNKITNAMVTAALPPNVRWIGIYSPASENIYFRGDNKTVPTSDPCQGYTNDICWSIGDIEPNVGLNGTPPRQVVIAIGFTPSTSQIGEEPALLQDISLTGTDASTGATVTRTATPDVTTNLAVPSQSSNEVVLGTDQGFSAANATVVK